MPYAPFHAYFPDVAERETRSVTVLEDGEVPAGTYTLLELYCNEDSCDCRRVFLYVVSPPHRRPLAVIAYGWEPRDFYVRWMGDDEPLVIAELEGPALNTASPQSSLAPALLKLVSKVILKDEAYVARIKRHYQMFRARVDQEAPREAIHERERSKRMRNRMPTRRRKSR